MVKLSCNTGPTLSQVGEGKYKLDQPSHQGGKVVGRKSKLLQVCSY